jgi:spermidine synthase
VPRWVKIHSFCGYQHHKEEFMNGLHITADLHACGCDLNLLTNVDQLKKLCLTSVEASGLTIIGDHWHRFPDYNGSPGGITGMVLLAESHLAVHTWPELLGVTLDVYVCNFTRDNSPAAHAIVGHLIRLLRPARALLHTLERGELNQRAS